MRSSTMRAILILLLTGTLAVAAWATPGAALEVPAGPVILRITGQITATNTPDAAEFDIAMLERLGGATLVTTTPWTNGPQSFVGVPMETLMDTVGAAGQTLHVTALNDYHAELPIEEFYAYSVLLAYRRNGELMSVRDKGPLWIVYPQDENPAFGEPGSTYKWVWQLATMEVR